MNKKKICIIISSILIFIIIICVALYLYSKNSQKLESSKSLESEEIQNEIIENTTTTTTIIETPKKEEIKEDPKPSQSTPSTNTEKYVKNDAMINKIRNVIQNNESDFMKQYGYNIVVDSSIKAQTNQFTYTENRVKSYITYKFGTIRIYAEDYYVNGNLIMTECYIL